MALRFFTSTTPPAKAADATQPSNPESFFYRATTLWRMLFYSLPLDGALLLIPLKNFPLPLKTENLDTWIYLALALALLFWVRQQLFDGLLWVRNQSGTPFTKAKEHTLIIPAIIALVTIVKLLSKLGGLGYIPLAILVLLLIWPLYRAYSKELKTISEHKEKLRTDLNFKNASMEIEALIFFTLPLASARAVSTLGALKVGLDTAELTAYIPYFVASFLLLAASIPRRDDYMQACGRCKDWTSGAYGSNGVCQACRKFLNLDKSGISASPLEDIEDAEDTEDLSSTVEIVDELPEKMVLPGSKFH